MRTLSSALLTAQATMSGSVYGRLYLSRGASNYTYGTATANPLLNVTIFENDDLTQVLEVMVHNGDNALTGLNLTGYQGVISLGYFTGNNVVEPDGDNAGNEFSPLAPMKVVTQRYDSNIGGYGLTCTFSLAGTGNQMGEDKASADYTPESTNTDTIKTIINATAGATLSCYSHCAAITVTWDSEDDLIDVFKPADYFRISYGDNRKERILWLLGLTRCIGRFEDDGALHIRKMVNSNAPAWAATTAYLVNDTVKPTSDNTHIYVCTTAGTSGGTEPTWGTTINGTTNDGTVVWTLKYDSQYTLVMGDHNFYAKGHRRRLVIPNWIQIESHPDQGSYSGSATDSDSYTALGNVYFRDYQRLRVTSNAQATLIAKAKMAKLQIESELGSAETPMNVGQEVFDLVKFTDARQNDYRIGNVLSCTRNYGINKFRMSVKLGSPNLPQPMGILAPTGVGGEGATLAGLSTDIQNLYRNQTELAKLLNILSDITDYVTKNGKIYLSDTTAVFMASYDPSIKRRVFVATPTTPYDVGDLWFDGSVAKRCTTARASGAYVAGDWTAIGLDEIADGSTYARLLATDISAGYIKLTANTVIDGEWYDESGVEIDATHGINIYGTNNALTTRATKAGTIQCYVGSDGKIYAGAGAVWLDSSGLTIKGQTLTFIDALAATCGSLYGGSDVLILLGGIDLSLGNEAGGGIEIFAGSVNAPEANTLKLRSVGSASLASGSKDPTPAGVDIWIQSDDDIFLYADTDVLIKPANRTYIDAMEVKVDSPSRALDTNYQNTSGFPILVIVTINTNGDNMARALIGTASPPTTTVAETGYTPGMSSYLNLIFMVPVVYYYRVSDFGGVNIINWREIRIGASA